MSRDGEPGTTHERHIEHCERCGRETAHAVAIELRTERVRDGDGALDRKPYRVATCRTCGEESARRVDDA